MGYRHFVANRSVVYHQAATAAATPGDDEADADLRLYRARWGDRARAYHREREARAGETAFSPENWETARERRRQARQDLLDARRDGRRYLDEAPGPAVALQLRSGLPRAHAGRPPAARRHPPPAGFLFRRPPPTLAMACPHIGDANLFAPPRQ